MENTMNLKLQTNRGPESFSSKNYVVILNMGEKENAVILVDSNGTYSWEWAIVIAAPDAETASKIENALQGLVTIYKK